MASNRIGRINEEIQRELAALLRTVKDPRVHGLVSITHVDTTPDLRYAKVFVSVLNQQERKRSHPGPQNPPAGISAGSWAGLSPCGIPQSSCSRRTTPLTRVPIS